MTQHKQKFLRRFFQKAASFLPGLFIAGKCAYFAIRTTGVAKTPALPQKPGHARCS
jgi:hypothetical protein